MLNDAIVGLPGRSPDLLALVEALTRLSKLDERKSKVVELRFFGGLSVEETASVLKISPFTVICDWNFAKAWLLSGDQSGLPPDRGEKNLVSQFPELQGFQVL
jgi:hypothetical protein